MITDGLERLSSHPKGSLEWLIDQYGVVLPKGEFTILSSQGQSDAKNFEPRTMDYTGNIEQCRTKNKKVYNTYGGYFTCVDGDKAFLLHMGPGVEEILKREGYINPEMGRLDSYKNSNYVLPPTAPGSWGMIGGDVRKNFMFEGGLGPNQTFDDKGRAAKGLNEEELLNLYQSYKATTESQPE